MSCPDCFAQSSAKQCYHEEAYGACIKCGFIGIESQHKPIHRASELARMVLEAEASRYVDKTWDDLRIPWQDIVVKAREIIGE